MDGKPITQREALELLEDLERRTLRTTPVKLPSGRRAEVRTVCMIFDDLAAQQAVPDGHVPQIFGSVLYSPEPESLYIVGLWTYGSAAEAKARHPEAVAEFESGRVHGGL
jgi:hypothetical protein